VAGTFTYDPTMAAVAQRLRNGETLVDTFTYRVSDGTLQSAQSATVTVTVTGVNDDPVAANDTYATADNIPLNTATDPAIAGVLANDSDPDGDAISVVVSKSDTVSQFGATVTMQTSGEFVYDPRASSVLRALQVGQTLSDTFTYTMADASGAEKRGTVTVAINGANSAPTPTPDQYATAENAVLTIAAPGVLTNDTDADSASLSTVAQTVTSTLGATVIVGADGGFSYDPKGSLTLRTLDTGESSQDTFTYQVTDGAGGMAAGAVTVTVTGISDPPNQNPTVREDVNGDGIVSPIDPLILINWINAHPGTSTIPEGLTKPPYLDPTGDNLLTPNDVLIVINKLNEMSARFAGEGEADEPVSAESFAQGVTQIAVAASSGIRQNSGAWAGEAFVAAPNHSDTFRAEVFRPVSAPRSDAAQRATGSPHDSLFANLELDQIGLDETLDEIANGIGGDDREEAIDTLMALI
jgi:VCBS repeat-containing protein